MAINWWRASNFENKINRKILQTCGKNRANKSVYCVLPIDRTPSIPAHIGPETIPPQGQYKYNTFLYSRLAKTV